jgi:hypothetical protein
METAESKAEIRFPRSLCEREDVWDGPTEPITFAWHSNSKNEDYQKKVEIVKKALQDNSIDEYRLAIYQQYYHDLEEKYFNLISQLIEHAWKDDKFVWFCSACGRFEYTSSKQLMNVTVREIGEGAEYPSPPIAAEEQSREFHSVPVPPEGWIQDQSGFLCKGCKELMARARQGHRD